MLRTFQLRPAHIRPFPSGFAAKLSSDGSQLLYSTFLGSPDTTAVQGVLPTTIAISPACASGATHISAGLTMSAEFPVVNPVQAQEFFPGATPPQLLRWINKPAIW